MSRLLATLCMVLGIVNAWGGAAPVQARPADSSARIDSASPARAASVPHVVAVGDRAALVLAPGGSTTVRVRVTSAKGKPLARRTVTFVAPGTGSSGRFAGGSGRTHTVLTGAGGVAGVRFTAGRQPGVFLLDARLKGQRAFTSIAVSVTARPRTAQTPVTIRQVVRRRLLGGKAEGAVPSLYGPVLLPAGSQLAEDAPLNGGDTAPAPTTLGAASWFLWIDDAPGMRFAHPTRFVTVAVGSKHPGTGALHVVQAQWWPNVALPGASLQPLIPAEDRPATQTGTRLIAHDVRTFQANTDKCAILLGGVGYGETGFVQDMNHMQTFFSSRGVTVYRPMGVPSTVADLDALLAKVKANAGCKKLFIYISSHGSQAGSISNGAAVLADSKGRSTHLSYDDLAQKLQPLAMQGISFTVILDDCFGGGAATVLNGYGLTGRVVAAADANTPAPFDTENTGYFTNRFLECFQQMPSMGITDDDMDKAVAWVRDHNSGFFVGIKPISSTIVPQSERQLGALPEIDLASNLDFTHLTLSRPPGFPPDRPWNATITFGDGTVARVYPPSISVSGGTATTDVSVFGVSTGVTTYRVDSHLDGVDYVQTGIVFVGSTVTVNPNPIEVGEGEIVDVTVTLGGAVARKLKDQSSFSETVNVYATDPQIADSTEPVLHFAHGEVQATLRIGGVKPGQTSVTLQSRDGINIVVPITVDAGAGVAIEPAGLNFGTQLVGATGVSQTVFLASTGKAPLHIATILSTSNRSAFHIQNNSCPSALAVGRTCSFGVSYTAPAPGPDDGTANVADDAPGSPQRVTLHGVGAVLAPADIFADYQFFGESYENHDIKINTGYVAAAAHGYECPGTASSSGTPPTGFTFFATPTAYGFFSAQALTVGRDYLFQLDGVSNPNNQSLSCTLLGKDHQSLGTFTIGPSH